VKAQASGLAAHSKGSNKGIYHLRTDFSKAFDSVNHVLLVRKLDLLGFPVDVS